VSDSNLLKNLRDKQEATDLYKLVQMAHGLLDEYNRRLESELRSRRYTAKMLQAYIQAQDRQIEYEEKLLDEYKSKLTKLNGIGEEIEKHRQNMPPDVNDIHMAPLPSAGDLFAR
jgi:hemerythrin-like domain-containing protein